MKTKEWLKLWLLLSIVIILFIGGLNYIIDPNGLNHFFNKEGLNSHKKTNTGYTYRFKTNIVRDRDFDILLLGTSRIGVMNPEIVKNYIDGDVFNFEIPASTTEIQHKLFMYTLKYNQIKTLIYGIDFMSFNESRTIKKDFKTFYKLQKRIEEQKKIKNYDLYFNIETLIKTIVVMYRNMFNKILIEEKYLVSNGMRDYVNYQDQLDRGVFNINKEINSSLELYFKSKGGIYQDYKFSKKYLQYFKKTIDYCKNNKINVIVYIPPMSSEHFDAIHAANYFDDFEKFKRELVKITNYTDFTGHNSITENKMNYWDSSHLKMELTPIIMEKLLKSDDKDKEEVFLDFGISVNKSNIDHHLKRQKSQLKEYDLKGVLTAK